MSDGRCPECYRRDKIVRGKPGYPISCSACGWEGRDHQLAVLIPDKLEEYVYQLEWELRRT